MNNKHKFQIKLFAILFTIGILLVFYRPAIAKGNFIKITISGGQLTSEIDITDPSLLEFFSFSYFPDSRTQDPMLGEGYLITRYDQQNKDESFHAVDILYYYPSKTGSGGYVFYDGLINGSSEYDGKWYIASAEGDLAFRNILATNISDQRTLEQSYRIPIFLAFPLPR
ncbi:MAG: hypothetical protein Q7U53_17190 [Anaerolineaceae bacterium]|nr:hypothetical protein [Anaerolineaceae bacterium]